MAKRSSVEEIESYRNRSKGKRIFTVANISQGLLLLLIMAASIYVAINGGPALPALVELNTNTPTYTPSITPTPANTATITPTPTETPDPENQCDCAPIQETVIVIITSTFSDTDTPAPLPTATETIFFTPTDTLIPTETPTPTQTLTATPSATPTPTQIIYTVKAGDTLGGIALRFGVTVEAIQSLNNLGTTLIVEGQTLQIPRP